MIDARIDYFLITIPRASYDQEPVRRFVRDVIPELARASSLLTFRVSECLVSGSDSRPPASVRSYCPDF